MKVIASLFSVVIAAIPAMSQDRDAQNGVPIYRVTVVERTMKAINYAYRTGPTMIDFRGTVCCPKPKARRSSNRSKAGRKLTHT